MDKLERIRAWLGGWAEQAGVRLGVDYLGKAAQAGAVFPQGRREIARKEDILGGVQCRYEETFLLRLRLPLSPEKDGSQSAAVLLDLQQWVRENPAPELGEMQTVQLRGGRLLSAETGGIAAYEAAIVIGYTQSV